MITKHRNKSIVLLAIASVSFAIGIIVAPTVGVVGRSDLTEAGCILLLFAFLWFWGWGAYELSLAKGYRKR